MALAVVGFAALPSMASATTPPEQGSAKPLFEAQPLLEEACSSGHECVWPQTEWQGARAEILCIGGYHEFGTKRSAKNRCANKKVTLVWKEPEVYIEVACMDPNGNRPNPGAFNGIDVGIEGSRC